MHLRSSQAGTGFALSIPRGFIILGLGVLAWLIAGLFLGTMTPAFAQSMVPIAAPEPTVLQQIVTASLGLVGVVITALVGLIAAEIRNRFNIEIEAKHREALQSALTNGVLWALQRAGWVQGQPLDERIIGAARSYVESSVPDALKKFGIDATSSAGQAALERLLVPHLPLPAGTIMPNGDRLVGPA